MANQSIYKAFERFWMHVLAAVGTKSDLDHNHDDSYDAKGAADAVLEAAQSYADSAANSVKDDLLNGAGGAYDTLKELGDLIDDNKDAIDVLRDVASDKADKDHNHDDLYYTESEVDDKLAEKSNVTHAHNYYGVCTTAAGTAAKTVEIDGFELVVGAMVIVKFDNANNASSPTLNVSGTGAKPMYRYGTTALSTGTTTTGWYADAVQMFVYDGTGWIRDYWNNTTYSNASLGQVYATCSTAAATTAKTVESSSYLLTTGGIVAIKFTNAVPANATLNINSKGAKSIYYNGAAITADVIKAGDVATFVYSTQYHLLSVDRWHEDIVNMRTDMDTALAGKSDTTHNHDNDYDAKGSASAVQEILDNHTADTTAHMTSDQKTQLSTAYTHANTEDAHVTAVLKAKLNGIEEGATKTIIDSALSSTSTNTVQNKVVQSAIQQLEDTKANKEDIPTKTSELTNDSGYITSSVVNNHNVANDAHNDIRLSISDISTKLNNFLNVSDTTKDQLSEIISLIEANADDIESITSGKVNVSDIINNLTTNVTNKPLSAAQGVAIKALIDALQKEVDDDEAELATHKADTTSHITSTERTNWNVAYTDKHTHSNKNVLDNTTASYTTDEKTKLSSISPSAEVNQNAFSNVKVGSTTVAADSKTDTIEFVGSNVTITPDATNDKVTFAVADSSISAKGVVQLTNSTSSTSTTTAATPNSVKSAYDLANTANTNATNAQTTADSKVGSVSLSSGTNNGTLKLTVDGKATDNIAVKGLGSAAYTASSAYATSDHTHNYAGSSSAGGSANSAVKLATARTINGVSFDGSANINITANPSLTTLTNQDLNNVKDIGFYNAGGGNSCTNRPTNVDAFGMIVLKNAGGYICQMLISGTSTSNIMYIRTNKNSEWTNWIKQYSEQSKPTPSEIGASASGHKHTVSEITDLTATATELNYMDGVTSNVQTQLNKLETKSDLVTTELADSVEGEDPTLSPAIENRFVSLENRIADIENEVSAAVARLSLI